MSRLDELIAELCPDGVEHKRLGEIVNLTMGTSPKGNTISKNPIYGIEFHQGKSYFGNLILRHSNTYTTKPSKLASAGSVIMSVRAPVGDSNITNREIAIGRGLCAMNGRAGLDNKFLYYFINANILEFKNRSTGSTFEAINTNDIKNIKIPVPPLPVQQEIVRILDKFTALEAELEARKKQYGYYRDELLKFDDSIPMFALGEVCLVQSGGTPSKKKPEYWENGTIKWLGSTVCQNHKTVNEVTNYISELGLKNSCLIVK